MNHSIDFHPIPKGIRHGTPECKCGIPTLLRADQKAKARSRLVPSPTKKNDTRPDDEMSKSLEKNKVVEDDMVFFWQCQSPGQTGEMKGCGFFKILDLKAEGRGPCVDDM